MRKQYHFWPGDVGLDAWDVDRLINLSLSQGLAVLEVPLASIAELDTDYWFSGSSVSPTVLTILEHVHLIEEVDPSYPIILGLDGRLMDGMHRVARAVLRGDTSIAAVRFARQPEPDFRNCTPRDLPY